MKSIQMLVLVVTLTFSTMLSANTEAKDAEASAITTEVFKRLEHPKFLLENDVLVHVTLTLNKNNELVVLTVDSENEEIVNYIKDRLNYKKVAVNIFNKGRNYSVPVRLAIK